MIHRLIVSYLNDCCFFNFLMVYKLFLFLFLSRKLVLHYREVESLPLLDRSPSFQSHTMPLIGVGNSNAYGHGAPPFRFQSHPASTETIEKPSGHLLQTDDVVAGMFLIIFGAIGIAFYTIVTLSMVRMSKDIVGFRFLISQSISDLLLLVQFAIWPGLVILTQNEILPIEWRWYAHLYLDFTWWAMVYHYPIVAWSRLAAVQFPNWFRTLKPKKCMAICSIAWIFGLIQSIVEHQFSWFQPLYYDPKFYGLTTDWYAYNSHGTATYYMIFNVSSMILPFPFYGVALYVLFTRQKRQMIVSLN